MHDVQSLFSHRWHWAKARWRITRRHEDRRLMQDAQVEQEAQEEDDKKAARSYHQRIAARAPTTELGMELCRGRLRSRYQVIRFGARQARIPSCAPMGKMFLAGGGEALAWTSSTREPGGALRVNLLGGLPTPNAAFTWRSGPRKVVTICEISHRRALRLSRT